MNIPNSNITLTDGVFVVNFSPLEGVGTRYTVITSKPKETAKKYHKAGFKTLCATMFDNGHFLTTNKDFKLKIRNGKRFRIQNELWHIEQALERGTLKMD
jgi:hypothetical protein